MSLPPSPNSASADSDSHAGPRPFQIQGCASYSLGGQAVALVYAPLTALAIGTAAASTAREAPKNGSHPREWMPEGSRRRRPENRSAQCGAALVTPGYTAEKGDKPDPVRSLTPQGPNGCRLSATDEGDDAAAACQSFLHLKCDVDVPSATRVNVLWWLFCRGHFDRCPEEKESTAEGAQFPTQTHVDAWRSMPRRAQKKPASALSESMRSESPRHRRDKVESPRAHRVDWTSRRHLQQNQHRKELI